MKLLTPQETKTSNEQEMARYIFRNEQIKEELKKQNQRLSEVNAQFDKRLNEQRIQWVSEEEKALKKIQTLNVEMEEMETKKRSLLFPIDAIERKAYDNLERSKKALEDVAAQKRDNDLLEDKLHEKLDSAEEKETELALREEKISSSELGIRDQQLRIKQLSEDLAKKWDEFNVRCNEQSDYLFKEKRVIELAKQSIERREDDLIKEKEQVENGKKLVASQRAALKNAFDELQRKQQ